MSTSLPEFRDLGRRMDLLEKQNRRLRAALVLATILGGAIIVAQQVPASLAQAERDNGEKDRLTLKDKDGKNRAWLGMGADGAPGLFFADPERKSSGVLSLGQGGLIFRLCGNDENPTAGISVQPDGVALAVRGPDGKPAIGVNALRTDPGNIFELPGKPGNGKP